MTCIFEFGNRMLKGLYCWLILSKGSLKITERTFWHIFWAQLDLISMCVLSFSLCSTFDMSLPSYNRIMERISGHDILQYLLWKSLCSIFVQKLFLAIFANNLVNHCIVWLLIFVFVVFNCLWAFTLFILWYFGINCREKDVFVYHTPETTHTWMCLYLCKFTSWFGSH